MYHLTTRQCGNDTGFQKAHDYFEHGEKPFVELQNKRFAEMTECLFHVINKVLLPSFESKLNSFTKYNPSKNKVKVKGQALAQKQVYITKPHLISKQNIL